MPQSQTQIKGNFNYYIVSVETVTTVSVACEGNQQGDFQPISSLRTSSLIKTMGGSLFILLGTTFFHLFFLTNDRTKYIHHTHQRKILRRKGH